ncbi:MAG TPA: alpha/beta hydrolase, partial [Paraburkholderia sp.]|nr:alpha/beta hydrolase [Paraburkholderia sp.]
MSWQSTLACWFLRRQFHPQTRHPVISAERARKMTAKRAYTPRVPAGWILHERYGEHDGPLRGEWLTRADGRHAATILYLHGGGYYFCSPQTHRAASF